MIWIHEAVDTDPEYRSGCERHLVVCDRGGDHRGFGVSVVWDSVDGASLTQGSALAFCSPHWERSRRRRWPRRLARLLARSFGTGVWAFYADS